MESIRELFRVGNGPSSSHTMGPRKAAEKFLTFAKNCDRYEVDLFGSLAATGKGHLTDQAIKEIIDKDLTINWFADIFKPFHPNALTFRGYKNDEILQKTYYSVGGGRVLEEGDEISEKHIYPENLKNMNDIVEYCVENGLNFWEFVLEYEDENIMDFVEDIYNTMVKSIKRGLENEGILKGGLKLGRKGSSYFQKAEELKGALWTQSRVMAYALAVSEENASGSVIVTAPTCGSSGILPAVLFYLKNQYKLPKVKIQRAMLTAALFGNIAKTNASISGAEVGCQGEVGVACAMASAAAAQILGGTVFQIEYAAEMGLEHHLGLTCDPLLGLVQIPCIERNAHGALRAIDCAAFALLSDGRHKVSYDDVLKTMMETGAAIPSLYRETSLGGLATIVDLKNRKKY